MAPQTEVRGNKKFNDVNQNNGNWSDVNRRTTVYSLNVYDVLDKCEKEKYHACDKMYLVGDWRPGYLTAAEIRKKNISKRMCFKL